MPYLGAGSINDVVRDPAVCTRHGHACVYEALSGSRVCSWMHVMLAMLACTATAGMFHFCVYVEHMPVKAL